MYLVPGVYGVCRHVTSRSKDQLGLDGGLASRIADRYATCRDGARGVAVGDFRLATVVEPQLVLEYFSTRRGRAFCAT